MLNIHALCARRVAMCVRVWSFPLGNYAKSHFLILPCSVQRNMAGRQIVHSDLVPVLLLVLLRLRLFRSLFLCLHSSLSSMFLYVWELSFFILIIFIHRKTVAIEIEKNRKKNNLTTSLTK